jgi:V/A-type H+-transporting ATPase subunit I
LERGRAAERLATVEAELAALARAHGARVGALRDVLEDRVAETRALREAGASEHLVVVGGWLPAALVAELREALATEIGPAVLVEEREAPARDADVPVAFGNRRSLRAFEPLASFVSVPRYGSLDPTPLLALTFPAFVGLMVGDAGYGLILLGLLLWARRRWRAAPVMAILWPIGVLSAAATIGFGILFGEWFGDAGQRLLGLGPLWLDRSEAIIPLLVLAISIGVAQVGLGLVLGMVNAVLLRHRGELARRGALLVSLVAVLVIIGWLARLMPEAMGQIALGALLVALVVLVASAGLAGPIEVIGVLGNVLSYARLMAIGLASVMLALVANRLGGLPENVVLGVGVAALIHALNLVLGFFDSSVQGMRLHYVEFFSKFVEPGGKRYAPFVSALARDGTSSPARASGGP